MPTQILSIDGVYDVAVNVPGCVSGLSGLLGTLQFPASYGILSYSTTVLASQMTRSIKIDRGEG